MSTIVIILVLGVRSALRYYYNDPGYGYWDALSPIWDTLTKSGSGGSASLRQEGGGGEGQYEDAESGQKWMVSFTVVQGGREEQGESKSVPDVNIQSDHNVSGNGDWSDSGGSGVSVYESSSSDSDEWGGRAGGRPLVTDISSSSGNDDSGTDNGSSSDSGGGEGGNSSHVSSDSEDNGGDGGTSALPLSNPYSLSGESDSSDGSELVVVVSRVDNRRL